MSIEQVPDQIVSSTASLRGKAWRSSRAASGGMVRSMSSAIPIILFVFGVGVLSWTYALRPAAPANYVWFWTGIGLCFIGTLTGGLRHVRAWQQMLALAAFGMALYIPYMLRSPSRLIFNDELYHYQVAQLISETGHTSVPVTLYLIAGEFPGLELATLVLSFATGLPLFATVRLITVLFHCIVPVLAYLLARGLSLGKRTSFVAALVYMTNTSYYFFHAVFSYESLGIVFALSLWVLLVHRERSGTPTREVLLLLLIFVGAMATHHITSILMALSVVVIWITLRLVRRELRSVTGTLALLSALFPAGWILYRTVRTSKYLSTTIVARVQGMLATIFAEQRAPRQLFQRSSLPLPERIVDFMYPPLLMLLALIGLFLLWRRLRAHQHIPPLLLAFAFFGPIVWIVTAPAVLTPAAEIAYRLWPFLFAGMGLFCGPAIIAIANGIGTLFRPARLVAMIGLLALLVVGGISIGDNQAGRFTAAEPTKAAGPEAITMELVSAAQWLERTHGRYNLIVGDTSSQVTFATYGFQRARTFGTWTPFVAERPEQVTNYLENTGTKFIVTDQRITRLFPRYQAYFGRAEILVLSELGYSSDRPFPEELLAKFDRMTNLSRIYDNGNIQIYKVATGAAS